MYVLQLLWFSCKETGSNLYAASETWPWRVLCWLRQKGYLSVLALVDHFSIMSTLNSFYINITPPNRDFCLSVHLATQDSVQLAHMLSWSSKGTASIHKQPFYPCLRLFCRPEKLSLHRDLTFTLPPSPPLPSQDLLVCEGGFVV